MRLKNAVVLGLFALPFAGCIADSQVTSMRKDLSVYPSLEDLGDVAVGAQVSAEFTLIHVSGGDIQVHEIMLDSYQGEDFVVTDAPEALASGEATTFTVSFSPEESGYHQAMITVVTDAAEEDVTAEVRARSGIPMLAAWPGTLDFGPLEAGDDASLPVTVVNQGGITVQIDAASFAGDQGFSFDTPLPATVEVGEVWEGSVNFEAVDEEPRLDTLVLNSADGGEWSSVAVDLRGNACEGGAVHLYDADGDGYASCAGDCDDSDADNRPGAAEVCDEEDNDCDGIIDEGTYCYDDDGDGVTEEDGDCNDGNADVYGGAAEVEDGVDNDCDGVIDDGVGNEDNDGDGYLEEAGDCDNEDATVYPGAPELPDGVDNDCDGTIDEGTELFDDDGDGMSEDDGDCNDEDASIYDGATEAEDGMDNDCDGVVDEGTDSFDDDGDGFSEDGGDCDDEDASVNPAALEIVGDDVDNDCDGTRA